MTIEWCKGNKELNIGFYSGIKDGFERGINVYRTESIKNVDSTYGVTYQLGPMWINYTNWKYDDVVYVMLESNKKYKNTECKEAVEKLYNILSEFSEPKKKFENKPPFSFAIETNFENGNEFYTYYITAKKEWFEKNNLECVIKPLLLAFKRDETIKNIHKFPKYNRFKKEVIWI